MDETPPNFMDSGDRMSSFWVSPNSDTPMVVVYQRSPIDEWCWSITGSGGRGVGPTKKEAQEAGIAAFIEMLDRWRELAVKTQDGLLGRSDVSH
jgi:hypothetical protein